jgi:negative regulator of flagellin synthesis FlgM
MTEKINGQGFRPVDAGSTRQTDKAGKAGGQTSARGPSAASGDTVNIERAELLIARLSEALEVVPIVDADRVRAVRDAIASGDYQIDPGVIADKILGFEREFNI